MGQISELRDWIPPEHRDIHDRLLEWGRWALTKPHYGHCLSIEHLYRSPQHWNPPNPRPPEIDELGAVEIEKLMRRLPDRNRLALKLRYVHRIREERILSRRLKTRFHDVGECLYRSRQMVLNLTRRFSGAIVPANLGTPLPSEIRSPVGALSPRKKESFRFFIPFNFWTRLPLAA